MGYQCKNPDFHAIEKLPTVDILYGFLSLYEEFNQGKYKLRDCF